MPSNRFNLTDAFGPSNEHIARISQICRSARKRNEEDQQEAALSAREGFPSPKTPPRAKGGSLFPSDATPRPSLAWDAKQDVKERYEAGELSEMEAIKKLQDLGLSVFDAMEFLNSWSDRR